MGDFIDNRLRSLRAPIAGPNGRAWATALGSAQVDEAATLRVSGLSRYPSRCPDDALDLIAPAFDIERFPGESNASVRARGEISFPTHKKATSPESVIDQLKGYGFSDVGITDPAYYYDGTTSAPTSAGLAFLPGNPIGYVNGHYTAAAVILGPDMGTTGIGPLLAPFVGGTNTSGGTTATRAQVRQIVSIILRWKWAFAYPVLVIFRFGDTAIGGINTRAPFTPAAVPQYACWTIGRKIQGVSFTTAPFSPADWNV